MVYEFEGKTEREAVDNAVATLGLEKDQFDVEIIEIQKNSLFKKGFVKIRVHIDEQLCEKNGIQETKEDEETKTSTFSRKTEEEISEGKEKIRLFIAEIIERMGYQSVVECPAVEKKQITIRISSPDSSIIIGKRAKNLDAMQFLANLYAASIGLGAMRVFIDCENYRIRREETLVRLAYETADKVSISKRSILLEPMNPYERRLIHTTLNDVHGVETKSEGEGLYKRVRVIYK